MRLRSSFLIVIVAVLITSLAGCGTRLAASSGGGSPSVPPAGSGGSVPVSGPQPGPTVGTGRAGTATASPARVVTGSASGAPTVRPGPVVIGRSGHVTLTEADNGVTVLLRFGQSITVVLGGHGSTLWHQPLAAGGILRRTSASGGFPRSMPARASFRAVQTGTTAISSITDAACLHARPSCEIAQRLWTVTVIVPGR